ncbi:hypothetical protein ECTPHS_04903 [Ectothiorhodospira sp. PHS-1]|nr:hypothetical protein ECTPHS_04903 [Ectothiorhodospira sp. PHS-1]
MGATGQVLFFFTLQADSVMGRARGKRLDKARCSRMNAMKKELQ